MLGRSQQTAIQSSIENLSCSTLGLAGAFYDRLFELAPEVREMFPEKMSAQVSKLEQTLVYVVGTMNDPESLFSVLNELGVAHGDLGARAEHYDAVGQALMSALRQNVTGWNTEQETAWDLLYHIVSTRMQSASESAKLNTAHLGSGAKTSL